MDYIPQYVHLYRSGELARRADALEKMLQSCTLCPLHCGNDRTVDEIARCFSGYKAIVSAYCPHFGEEPQLSGSRGVGNIFFGNCNLRCVYCQNYEISQRGRDERKNEVSDERLAEIMLELQNDKHCHSIGLVSPTHFTAQIVRALLIACSHGLSIPLIYNTNCYDSVDVLKLLDGIIDIYLPDVKYADEKMGYAYSGVKDYVASSRLALREMYRQTGSSLTVGEDGLIKRGLIIRHLVLPNDLADSRDTLTYIAKELSNKVTLSIMNQYYPTNKVNDTAADLSQKLLLLNRYITDREYERVLGLIDELGFENGWIQETESREFYRPNFSNRVSPFEHQSQSALV
jgi:putative pyruvate formate lyase activating enzyme